jgi:spore maturation protein CgeB
VHIAFFGSSILSSYWNGAATYYRGLLKGLVNLGHQVTFYEPDAYQRQENRDLDEVPGVESVIYSGADAQAATECVREAQRADVLVKASGVGVFDELLESSIAALSPSRITLFWDVDAPATLERILSNPVDSFRAQLPRFHSICTYGGGARVVEAYGRLGARACVPIYNAVDPETHFRVPAEPMFTGCLSFQGNRLPDRETRVEEFFLKPATLVPHEKFVLGGSGWGDKNLPANIDFVGHVPTQLHNAFNSSAEFVLNVNRDSMARYGFSPPTRVFEAAAAAACIITDAWEGVSTFLCPSREILVAEDGAEVVEIVRNVSSQRARQIGDAGRKRILAEHTYAQRARQVDSLLRDLQNDQRSLQKVYA